MIKKLNLKIMKKIIFVFLMLLALNGYTQPTRMVLFEEGTNASCGPCAASNPILIAYLLSHPSNTLSIMYHSSWPGADPMYSANPTQNTERVQYNNITAVPTCNVDGIIYDIWPFSASAFDNAVNTRMAVTPPLSITVTDTRMAGDSIKSVINITITTALTGTQNYLRVMAVEKKIIYSSPPGGNGETEFNTVFRRAYPNTTGITMPTAPGTYNYTYTYKREATWRDTSIYTVAFVQNDVNKEVLNAAKGTYITNLNPISSVIPKKYELSQNYPNPFNPVTNIKFALKESGLTTLKIFDIMGREVAVLVNEQLQAGNYVNSFDASYLSSGIYFYKLESGDFREVKKMTVIK